MTDTVENCERIIVISQLSPYSVTVLKSFLPSFSGGKVTDDIFVRYCLANFVINTNNSKSTYPKIWTKLTQLIL